MGLIIHFDGGARGNPGPAGAGVVIASDDGRLLFEAAYFLGRQTNNAAEYLALIRALHRAERWRPATTQIHSDSELVVRQITGEYRVKSPKLAALYQQAQVLLLKVGRWSIHAVAREENHRADELANMAMDRAADVLVFDCEQSPDNASSCAPALATEKGTAEPQSIPKRPKSPAEQAGGPTRPVHVVVARAPDSETCPAGQCPHSSFTIEAALPAGLCVHAAHAILPTALAIQNTASEEFAAVPTLTVRCLRPGCEAVFQISPGRSTNGADRRRDAACDGG